jgi:hypothetical protein
MPSGLTANCIFNPFYDDERSADVNRITPFRSNTFMDSAFHYFRTSIPSFEDCLPSSSKIRLSDPVPDLRIYRLEVRAWVRSSEVHSGWGCQSGDMRMGQTKRTHQDIWMWYALF